MVFLLDQLWLYIYLNIVVNRMTKKLQYCDLHIYNLGASGSIGVYMGIVQDDAASKLPKSE